MEKVRLKEKLGMGGITLSINLVEQFVSAFLLFYLTDVFGLSPALAGVVLMLGRIWDGVNDPIIGFFADNRRFKSGERVRPYALYFCLPLAVCGIIMFTRAAVPDGLKFAYALFMYIIFDTLVTIIRLPSYGIPMLATSDPEQRITINTYVSGAATLGGVLASLMCWPLVRGFGGVNADGTVINGARGFFWTAAVIGVFIVIGSLVCYFTTKERVKPIDEREEKIGAGKALSMMLHCRCWIKNSAFTLFYYMSNLMVTTSLVYYATYVLKNSGAVTTIMAAFAAGSLVVLPLVSYVSKRFGRRIAMMTGASLLILAKLIFLAGPYNMLIVMVNSFITGLSVGFSIVLFSTNRADMVDIIEWKQGRRLENLMSTLSGFIAKCGSSIATLLIGFALELTHYVADAPTQTPEALRAIVAFQGLAPLVIGVIMLAISTFITLDGDVSAMNAEKALKGIA
ncbi:MAG TPA: glycoside-pentoside-hexuronide (GPH):cation symporter [Clostridia bacterium]|nr:glycoside-pentoside-hexuronide (GPH):cation symporter [Clostridia bacterium]